MAISAGLALIGAMASVHGHAVSAAVPACPAGVPAQAITVVDRAGIPAKAMRKVERAAADQSMQVRAAWGTPCVRFVASGGWLVTLTDPSTATTDGGASFALGGHHYADPSAAVETGGNDPAAWPRAFTHELIEMLVNPTLTRTWRYGQAEACDPVDETTYPVDGIQVSDFVYPSYFTGEAGPWDQASMLNGPSAFS